MPFGYSFFIPPIPPTEQDCSAKFEWFGAGA